MKAATIRNHARQIYIERSSSPPVLSGLHRDFNHSVYVAYVDLKSAFDSVDREAPWKAVRGVGFLDQSY